MRKIKKHLGLTQSRYNTFKTMMSLGVIVFLICSILFTIFFTRIEKELKSNFKDVNDYLVTIVQNQFQNSLNFSTSVILDPANQKIAESDFDKSDLYNYSLRLNSFVTTNPLVDTLFVYYPKFDIVVCDYGIYTLKEFYLTQYGYQNKNLYMNWQQDLILSKQTGFSYNSNFENKIFYTRISEPRDAENNPKNEQIINFSFDLKGLTIEDNKAFVDELGFIIDDELILLKSNNLNSINQYLNNDENYLLDNLLINYQDSLIYKNILPYSNISLITSMNLESYKDSMFFLILASILTLIITFLIAITYSLRASKNILQPFREIAYRLSPNKYSKDSLVIINDKINSLLEEESYKDEIILKQTLDIQNVFLSNIVFNEMDKNYFNYLINKNDIVFPYSSFVVFVSINKKANDLLINTSEELFFDIPSQINLIEYNDELIGIINIEEDQEIKDSIIVELEAYLKINSIALNKVKFCISDLLISIYDIHYGYVQCKYILDKKEGFSSFVDNSTIIVQDLKKSFENNDIKLYKECIDKVFKENQYLPYDLLSKLIFEIKQYDSGIQIKVDNNRVSKDEFMPLLRGKSKNNESYNSIVTNVNNIISRSFKDVNLGLFSISEELKVSNTYISSVYKDHCGVGIVHQINKKRIEFAKSLLLTTDMSVKEVALASGFSSDISFIRVFKKMEDLTPGKMRKKKKS
ncbi:MAG: helix-turn-helix domain-containing protein [Pleomorphochaeta sp.]